MLKLYYLLKFKNEIGMNKNTETINDGITA